MAAQFFRSCLAKVVVALSSGIATCVEAVSDSYRDNIVLKHGLAASFSQWATIAFSFAFALTLTVVAVGLTLGPLVLSACLFFVFTIASAYSPRFGWAAQSSESLLIWSSIPLGSLVFCGIGVFHVIRLLCRSLSKWLARFYVYNIRKRFMTQRRGRKTSLLPLAYSRRARKPFRFLDLPPELRNRIYDTHIQASGVLDCMPTKLLRPNQTYRKAVNLFQTCRQIREEAYRYFFTSTLFVVPARYPFYRSLQPSLLNYVSEMSLVAQSNSRGYSGLYSILIYDLPRMARLQDLSLYMSYEDYVKWQRLISVAFNHLKRDLPSLSFAKLCVSTLAHNSPNVSLQRSLSACLDEARASWPATTVKRVSSEPFSAPKINMTLWQASLTLQGYIPSERMSGRAFRLRNYSR